MKTKDMMRGYQWETVNHIINCETPGTFLDMGLGKTVSTLTAVDFLMYRDLDITKALVIAPKRVAEMVWIDEINDWEHLSHLKISVVSGTEKQRKAALAERADIYTIGRDNVSWLCGLYGGTSLPFDMLIVDESSSFKNPKSQRFKALKKVAPSFKRVVILTGTPAPNGLIDIWSQIYLLDQGKRLGKFITQFRDMYFKPNQRNGEVVYNYKLRNPELEKLIYKKIGDICISMKTSDYIELPEVMYNYVNINLPKKIQDDYNEFEREQVLEIFGEDAETEITAVNAAALSNKLLQYAGGSVYDQDRNVHPVHGLKLDALEEIIDTSGDKPILVAWNYQHERDRILERFKKYKPRNLKTTQDIKDWNEGKIRLFLMHPASGGHGLNLQSGGSIIVWYSPTWSLELYMQLNKRLHRPGQQAESVILHHLVAHKTIDSDVIESNRRKEAGQNGLLNAVKARINKYLK